MQVDHKRTQIENDFTLEKARFIENYNLARPIMTILGDEVRQEILLSLIESGGMGGIRVGDIQKKSHVSRLAVFHHLKFSDSILSSGKQNNGLYPRCERELVHRHAPHRFISVLNEDLQVARKTCGLAGNIYQTFHSIGDYP